MSFRDDKLTPAISAYEIVSFLRPLRPPDTRFRNPAPRRLPEVPFRNVAAEKTCASSNFSHRERRIGTNREKIQDRRRANEEEIYRNQS
jgi:hypothetical protein